MRPLVLATLLLLSACALFGGERMTWYKPDRDEADLEAELEGAQLEYELAYQEAMQNPAQTYDPSGSGDPRFGGGHSTDAPGDATVMVDKDEIVRRFMQARGWIRVSVEEARIRREEDRIMREHGPIEPPLTEEPGSRD